MTTPSQTQPAIKDALEKNEMVKEKVEHAAHELAVVHAVLDKKLPPEIVETGLEHAVRQTKELTRQLDQSTQLLKEVNETLAAEVHKDK